MGSSPLDARGAARLERIGASFPEFAWDVASAHACIAEHPRSAAAWAAETDAALAEIYLVAAIRAEVRGAALAFETRYLAPLRARLARLGLSDEALDEVKQRTREKLLVASEQAPRIVEYAGQGRLAGLIQVVATREALSLFRGRRRDAPMSDGAPEMAFDFDPGVEMLKGRARAAFVQAFARAVGALSARDRTLLRLHLVGGVTLEQLAKMHQVHRATVVRWLASAREQILQATRERMGSELGVHGAELDSLVAGIQSRLDVSVERLLQSLGDPESP